MATTSSHSSSSNRSSSARQLVLLAPSTSNVPASFRRGDLNAAGHESLLADLQRLRGRIYLEDGAIGPEQLDAEGRHRQAFDEESWHMVVLNAQGAVAGCARYLPHQNTAPVSRLGVLRSALAQCEKWGWKLHRAVEAELARARRQDMPFVEVGGWALDAELRCTTEALRMALATYALARNLGGCLGATTATVRHCSASILRRIGGRPLQLDGVEMPQYFDPAYGCDMEILRFDSSTPNPKYDSWVEELRLHLQTVRVVCRSAAPSGWQPRMAPAHLVAEAAPAGWLAAAAHAG